MGLNLVTLKILHYISKLNFVAHGVKFGYTKNVALYFKIKFCSSWG